LGSTIRRSTLPMSLPSGDRTVVIQQGGTLGIGGKSVSMPWESMKVARDGDSIVLTAEQQMLDQAPAASPRTDSKSEKNRSDSDKK
jgi:hypothetical protein